MKYFFLYPALINLTAAVVCIADKRRARKHKRRVPEATLFALCFWGGGVGMYLAMLAVRHKTRHLKFMLGVPAIALAETAAFFVIYFRFFA